MEKLKKHLKKFRFYPLFYLYWIKNGNFYPVQVVFWIINRNVITVIVTKNEEDIVEKGGRTIRVVPIVKF